MTNNEPDTLLERLTRTKPRRYAFYVLLAFLGFGLTFVAASHLDTTTDSYNFTEGAMFAPGDGPVITLGENVSVDRQYPLTNETVNLLPFAQFTGDTSANATISNASETFINISDMNVSAGNLTIDPGDARPLVTVSGGATKLEYRDYEADDGQVDLRLTTSGATTLNLSELPDSEFITIWNDTTQLDRATVNDGGMATLETDQSGDLFLKTDDPGFSNETPEDGAFVDQQTNVDLNITVDHPALEQGDSIDVDFYDASDDSLIGSDTLSTQGGEASTTWSVNLLGQHEWYAETNDSGRLHESATYSFETPHNLTLYDEQTLDILDNDSIDVTVTIFGEEEIHERTATNGNITLDGVPNDEVLIVRSEADGYFTRQTVIRDITKQHEVYLLNESADASVVEFALDDPTNQFDDEDFAVVERALNESGTIRWVTISAVDFGADTAVTTLENDVRYRLSVEDFEDGTRRDMGGYVPAGADSVTLQIEEREISIEEIDAGAFTYGAGWVENDGSVDEVHFEFSDDLEETEEITVKVYERNNESNEIVNQSYMSLGNLTANYDIPEAQENVTAWVVEVSGTTDGESWTVSEVINEGPISFSLPATVTSGISIILVLLIGGLLGGHRADMGAIVAGLTAGIFAWIGWLPAEIGVAGIGAALFIAGLYRLVVYQKGVPQT